MLDGKNKSINEQIIILEKILKKNLKIMSILKALENYSKENPSFTDYYLAAGCINQTVFSYYHNQELNAHIKDYDIVYFDEDTSYEAEDKIIKGITKRLENLDVSFDIKNQKRVPIWYKEKYGIEKKDCQNVEEAISRMGATITCIGVRLEGKKLIVVCPYGLNDLFLMKIRLVSTEYEKNIFQKKCQHWQECWPKLKVIDDN